MKTPKAVRPLGRRGMALYMKKRLLAVFCLTSFLMGILFWRLYALGTSEKLITAAGRQGTRTLTVSTSRGMIYDCNFDKLVNSRREYVASVLPSPESASLLLDHVPVQNRTSVLEQLEKGKLFTVKLQDPLPRDTTELHTFPVTRRYAEGQIAPHIIGHMTNGGLDGGYGIEKAYDSFLKENTTKTTITYYLDAMGRSIQGIQPEISLTPESAAGVVLTLDSRIQRIAEEAGKKRLSKGAVVVMTPDGKIKACASFPSFDPNDLTASLKDEANKPMFNRAFGSYSVGSTFKISTAAAALESGVAPHLSYTCTGKIDVRGQIFNCHRHTGHGRLTMQQAMAESCNPYFISLGLQTGQEKLLQIARDLSFSKSFTLAPGFATQSGYLPNLQELYNPADVANFSFGQGKLMATPIQVALMTCAVVNNGKTPAPQLVEGISSDGRTLSEQAAVEAPTFAFGADTAETLRSFLVHTVMSKSTQQARPTKTTAGGKTATAQTGNFKGDTEITQGWFTGFFPAEDPEYIVTVLCEDAKSGNESAGPVFRDIADGIAEAILQPENPDKAS